MTGRWLWRGMRAEDLDRVVPLADTLFPDHPEETARFAERLARAGALCLTLADKSDRIGGYAIAYPWPLGRIPGLNRPLAASAEPADAIYLNDLGVHPTLSGAGHARAGLGLLVGHARAAGLRAVALVAVNGSAAFWAAMGFEEPTVSEAIAAKLASYGAGARYMVLTL
ncbi:GNAT family N-acetyltransferase [Methylobacterium sp. J-068]|uniref:GNAT family N-acetyltransferase n=1 Tax=Methylobacterium sp. J-068 TaxID=2836649 RepID=UPI001FB979AC|nr:GNAT family N-acetyltransferase [Methylobacterium sp. J-068]MCJ2037327.1 GNAT family N-acetyltransferase [Methylobacterium sp. J-068]